MGTKSLKNMVMLLKNQSQRSNYNEWVSSIVDTKLNNDALDARNLQLEAQPGNRRQDLSRPILEDLLNAGYQNVTWDAGSSAHSVCRELHNQAWSLEDFLTGLLHDAPLFERSHPGDTSCQLIVTGPDVQDMFVDSFGRSGEV